MPLLFLPAYALAFVAYRPPFEGPAANLAWQLFAVAVSLAGLAIRVKVVGHAPTGTSGRNQAAQRAESLTTAGMYSVVRHPLYLGNALLFLGVSLLPGVWYLPVIVALGTALYYERIMLVEESFLEDKFGEAFRAWAASTPAIVPAWRQWRPPALPFCWPCVLRTEIYAAFTVVLMVYLVDSLQRWIHFGRPQWSPLWGPIAAAGAVVWLVVRQARKHTRLLEVKGR